MNKIYVVHCWDGCKEDGWYPWIDKELSNDIRILDVYSNEHLDMNGMIKYMKEYMNYARPKEVFDEFVEHKGRYYPFSLELGTKYAKEDNNVKPYSVAKLQNYLYAYIKIYP